MTGVAEEIQKKEAQTPEGVERTRTRKLYTPAVDIMEREADITVVADMPGVNEDSVDITLDKNILTIYGRIEPAVPRGLRLVAHEYGVGDYQRVFTLPDAVDREKIRATVKNGVLRMVLPKAEEARTRKIPVASE